MTKKANKLLAGAITAIIGLILLLAIVSDSVAKIVAISLCVIISGGLLAGLWWLIVQLLEGK